MNLQISILLYMISGMFASVWQFLIILRIFILSHIIIYPHKQKYFWLLDEDQLNCTYHLLNRCQKRGLYNVNT